MEVLQVDMYQDKVERDLDMDFFKYQVLNLSMLPYLLLELQRCQGWLYQWHMEATREWQQVDLVVMEYYHH